MSGLFGNARSYAPGPGTLKPARQQERADPKARPLISETRNYRTCRLIAIQEIVVPARIIAMPTIKAIELSS
jgi:hypothetical protein